MPRTVRDARLETRAARERLPAQREPHWRALGQGEHLGYYKGATGGTWIARWRPAGGGAYRKKRLGLADDVRDADGASVLSFAQAQAAARRWLAEMSRAAAGMEPTPAGPYRVRDATADYLKWFQKHRKSAADTRNKIDYYILPDLGDIAVSELTTARLRAWHETIATSNRGRRKSKKPQSATKASKATLGGAAPVGEPSGDAAEGAQADPTSTKPNAPPEEKARARRATANRALTVLKALLTFAFGENKVASDLAWRRVKPFGGANSARVRYLSADEAQRLINACDPDFRRLVRAGLETGCRYGELRSLLVEDFHQDAPSLLIRNSKGGKPRHVPLDQQAAQFFTTVCAGRPGGEPMLRREGRCCVGTVTAAASTIRCQQEGEDHARGELSHAPPHLGLATDHGRDAADGRGPGAWPLRHSDG